MDPVVSVIVPAFNTIDYVDRAVASALGQTLLGIEVIVVDDGSTDGTTDVLMALKDPRLVVLRTEDNLGASAARNRALERARAPWIAVLDSDDWYHPRRLETLVAFGQRHDADLAADDLYIVDEDDDLPRTTLLTWAGRRFDGPTRIGAERFVLENVEGRPGARLGYIKPVFRREFLMRHGLGYDTGISVSHDFWLDMECLVRGGALWLLPEPFYYYRCRRGGLSSNPKAVIRIRQEIAALDAFLQRHETWLEKRPEVKRALLLKRGETRRQLAYQTAAAELRKSGATALPAILGHLPWALRVFCQRLPGRVRRLYIRWRTGKPAPERFF